MMLSSHLYFGLPLGLVVKGFHLNIFLAALASGILCIWPNRELNIYLEIHTVFKYFLVFLFQLPVYFQLGNINFVVSYKVKLIISSKS